MASMAQIKFQAPQSVPPLQRPGSSYEQPFELLDACHERVERSLQLLMRLHHHLGTAGLDDQARDASRDVRRYFDIAAPLHHDDEERHVFPRLEQTGLAPLLDLCDRLRDDHLRIAAQWAVLGTLLIQIEDRPDGPVPTAMLDVLGRAAEAFVALHDDHVRLERDQAFPSAREGLTEDERQAMGEEMAARRGLDLRQRT